MEHWRDWQTGQAKDLGEVWALGKNGHRTRCILQGHPIGTEARVLIDDEVQRTEAFRNQKAMIDTTTAWREMFERKGWSEPFVLKSGEG